MDPLSAIAIACAVAQFVDFGAEVLSRGFEISKSVNSATQSNSEAEAITNDIENLSQRISKSLLLQAGLGSLSQNDVALGEICKGCQDIASILLARLDTFKAQMDSGKWKLFSKAFLSAWSAKEIKEMRERLESYRRQLDTHILVDLRENFVKADYTNWESFRNLDQITRDGIDSILRGQNTLTNNQDLQTSIITGSILQEGLKTRSVLLRAIHEEAYDGPTSQLMVNMTNDANRFLATLRYTVMGDRFEQIKDSHDKTFEWIFKDPKSTTRPYSNFSTWLQKTDQGLYWINGKAGSGKSTLMAFLRNHPSTGALLTHWSKDIPLLKGSFFLWNSGSPLQRTQNGMLRSLLHEILSQNLNLIPIIAPDYRGKEMQFWNDRVLRKLLQKLCTQDTTPIKLFLLIDGLDEYEGDHLEIATFIKELSGLSNLKICVSSRPLPIFDLAFESAASLQLQNLTFDDIRTYVYDKLLNNPLLAKMHRQDRNDVQVLIDSLALRAQGVFLWIRVEACPKKLEELYAYMLQQIDLQHKEHSSRLFQIIETAHRETSLNPGTVLSARKLRFADTSISSVIAAKVRPLDRSKLPQELKSLALCLKTRCAGLVELVDCPPVTHAYNDRYERAQDELVHVEYIHRSAREFLNQAEFQASDVAGEEDNAFDPHLALLGSALMEIKTLHPTQQKAISAHLPTLSSQRRGVLGIVAKALIHASKTYSHSLLPMVMLVDEIDGVMTLHWDAWLKALLPGDEDNTNSRYCDHFDPLEFLSTYDIGGLPGPPDPRTSMVTLAAKFGLLFYVRKKINENPQTTIFKIGRPLLDYAARPAFQFFPTRQFKDPSSFKPFFNMIAFLLDKGCDPNETWNRRTPWETLLLMADHHFNYHFKYTSINGSLKNLITPDYLEMWLQVFRLFINHGASGKAKCLREIRLEKGGHEVFESDAPTMILDVVEGLRPFVTDPSFLNDEEDYERVNIAMARLDAEVKNLLESLAGNDGKTIGNRIRHSKVAPREIIFVTPASQQSSSSKSNLARRIFGCF